MTLTVGQVGSPGWLEVERLSLERDGAKISRLDYSWMTTTTSAANAMRATREHNARPCVMFEYATSASTILAFAQTNAMTAEEIIELGNETSYSYKTATERLASTAQAYANYAVGVRNLLVERGIRCQIVVQGDPAQRGTTWIENLYIAQPGFHRYFAGFTVHPYGPRLGGGGNQGYKARLEETRTQLLNHGAPTETALYVTEYGISTDNGRTLSENYGWPTNMTYQQASDAQIEVLRDIKANFTYVKIFLVYQNIDQANTGVETNRESYFGILQHNWTPKPICAALKAFIEESGGAQSQTGEARLSGRGTLAGNAESFPNIPIVDNFNRANAVELGANWTTGVFTGVTMPEIAANFVRPAADGAGPSGALWNPSRWADVGVSIKKAAAGSIRLFARMTAANGNGYQVLAESGGTVFISRVDAGARTTIATFSQALAAGDYLGMVVRGSTIFAWYRPAAAEWRLIGSARDTTYTAAGYTGFVLEVAGVRVDDFSAGALVAQSQTDEARLSGIGTLRAEGSIGRKTYTAEARLPGLGVLIATGRGNTKVLGAALLRGLGTLLAGTRTTTTQLGAAVLGGTGTFRGEGTVRAGGTSTPTWSNILVRYGTWQQVATHIAGATTFVRPRS